MTKRRRGRRGEGGGLGDSRGAPPTLGFINGKSGGGEGDEGEHLLVLWRFPDFNLDGAGWIEEYLQLKLIARHPLQNHL